MERSYTSLNVADVGISAYDIYCRILMIVYIGPCVASFTCRNTAYVYVFFYLLISGQQSAPVLKSEKLRE